VAAYIFSCNVNASGWETLRKHRDPSTPQFRNHIPQHIKKQKRIARILDRDYKFNSLSNILFLLVLSHFLSMRYQHCTTLSCLVRYSKESKKLARRGYKKLSGSAGVRSAHGGAEGACLKAEGSGYEKLSGPASVETAGPGQRIRSSLRISFSTHQEPLCLCRRGHGGKLEGSAIGKLSSRGFQDSRGGRYGKLRRRTWAGSKFSGFRTVVFPWGNRMG